MQRIMILKGGSPALHKVGNIGRKLDDFVRVYDEDGDYYVGNFEEGFGFVDVKFAKTDCRPLTQDEVAELNGNWYCINGMPLYRLYLDKDGNIVEGTVKTVKGIITKVTDKEGQDKNNDYIGLYVEFGEDITIGKSVVMITDEGFLSTSKVTNLVKVTIENQKPLWSIFTKNSVYTVEVQ